MNDIEVLKGLNKTIDKLRKENRELLLFKENFISCSKSLRESEKQLEVKRTVVKVVGVKPGEENVNYAMQIVEQFDSPEGMYIKVNLI